MFTSLQPCNLYQYCKFTVLRPFNHFNLMSLEHYSFIACILQSKWFESLDWVGCLPSWTRESTTHWVGHLNLGPPGNLWKTIKFQACSQYHQKSLKVSPRSPKDTKMWPKTLPQDTQLVNKWKKWNHSKTTVFIVVIAHTASPFCHHFHPWITQNMDLETVSHFGIPNQWKITNMSPKWVPGDSPKAP